MNTFPPSPWRVCIAVMIALTGPASSEMLYHVPFDQDRVPSEENLGSVGGPVTSTYRKGGGHSQLEPAEGRLPSPHGFVRDFSELIYDGKVGPAMLLPESADRLHLSEYDEQLTISAWLSFRPGVDRRQVIVSKASPSMEKPTGSGWAFMLRENGALQFALMGGITKHFENITSETLTPGDWHHVAVVVRSGLNDGTRYFIDGREVFCNAPRLGNKTAIQNDSPIALAAVVEPGIRDRGFGLPLGSSLDDVALWKTTLSEAKIKALFTLPSILPGADASVLNQLFALFDERNPNQEALILGHRWTYVQKIPSPGHAGAAASDGKAIFLPLDPDGSGVIGK